MTMSPLPSLSPAERPERSSMPAGDDVGRWRPGSGDLGRVALLCGTNADDTNAILEYTRRLHQALEALGVDCQVVVAGHRIPRLQGYDTVVLQYNPFLYGRWGFAPSLIRSLATLRWRRSRPRIALMVHEMYFPISDIRSAVMGSWQRIQLRSLHALSDVVFTAIERWTSLMSSWRPRRRVVQLPVGSNMPDGRAEREAARTAIGAGERTVVLLSFGTGHPSRLMEYVVASANAVAQRHEDVLLLNLGAGARKPVGLDSGVNVCQPGGLCPAEVSRLLSTGDIFLAPLVDGISARRGSVMAALQHGLPVVGTYGSATDDSFLKSGAVRLVPADDRNAFAAAAAELGADAGRRRALGAAAAALYRREFDWPVIAGRMCSALQGIVDA